MSEFLCSGSSPMDYCSSVLQNGQTYNGFALVTADLRYVCKIEGYIRTLSIPSQGLTLGIIIDYIFPYNLWHHTEQLHIFHNLSVIIYYHSADGSLAYCSNRESEQCQWVEPGIHGLSNHQLNSPWRKVERGKERLREMVATLTHTNHTREELTQQLLQLLSDDTW